MAPFRTKSLEGVRKELANVRVVDVPGAHGGFFVSHRAQVVEEMQRFLRPS